MTNLKELETIVSFLGVGDTPQKVDVIFVYGHYRPIIAEHAANLYKQGLAPYILISGQKTRYLNDSFENEAQFFKKICMDNGVPESAIILEEKSQNTLEDTVFGIETLRAHGIAAQTVILCAYVPLLRRAKATFAKQFPEIATFAVPYEITDLENTFWLQDRLLRMLLEFDRLQDFAEKGDIAPTEVPENVKEAAEHVRANLPEPPKTTISI